MPRGGVLADGAGACVREKHPAGDAGRAFQAESDFLQFLLVGLDRPDTVTMSFSPRAAGNPGGVVARGKMKERCLSAEEIAAPPGVNPGTVYKWIGLKKLLAHNAGQLWEFMASEADARVGAGKAVEALERGAQGVTSRKED